VYIHTVPSQSKWLASAWSNSPNASRLGRGGCGTLSLFGLRHFGLLIPAFTGMFRIVVYMVGNAVFLEYLGKAGGVGSGIGS
jgi:hypothetical protein